MNRETVIEHIIERLGTAHINYRDDTGVSAKNFAAGVLIPLLFTARKAGE